MTNIKITPLNITASVLLIAIAAYILGRLRKSRPPAQVTAPVDQSQLGLGFNALVFAQKAHAAFDGWNFWSESRREVLNDLWRLNDAQLSAVYNTYNQEFATPPYTLLTVIEGDWVFGSEVDRVTNRMKALGLV